MEVREVLEKSKDLQKATAANADPSTIVSILEDLRRGVEATEPLLRSTKIGVVVNRSKAHKDAKVARTAGEIVKKWRDDIEKQKEATAGTGGSAAQAPKTASTSTNGSKNSSASPKNGATGTGTTSKAGSEVALDQRNFTVDKVNVNRTNQATRDRCIGLLYNGLCYESADSSSSILDTAIAIEAAGYQIVGPETSPGYTTKMRSLYMNLKNKSNPKLRRSVLDGEISPEELIKMSSEDLKSDERRKADTKLMQENLKDAQMPQIERSISTAIQCSNPKCGKGTVAYTQAQTRSADEPMTTFCECQSCGKRWKFS